MAASLAQFMELYQRTLFDDVLPFWQRHACDANGGINTCIAADGKIISREAGGFPGTTG